MASKGQSLKQKRVSDSLLETLRELGNGTAKSLTEDFFGQIPEDIFAQGGLRPKTIPGSSEPRPYANLEELEEIRRLRGQLRQSEVIRQEEKVVFSYKEQETKVQVTALQQEIQKLAHSTQGLTQEIKVAAMQTTVEAGVYHASFFGKLISFIKSLTQKIEDASLWLSSFNNRAKKRPHYWAQVQKSGSKYLLSHERYMSTQAG